MNKGARMFAADLMSFLFGYGKWVTAEKLANNNLMPIDPNLTLPTPTVNSDSRCQFNELRAFTFTNHSSYCMARSVRAKVETVIRCIVTEKITVKPFPMATLSGCSASKSFMSFGKTYDRRRETRSMAEFGSLIDDLPRLDGLVGRQIIDKCMTHSDLRLDQGIRVFSDNWHHRTYWQNAGGSHHMAVLCHELLKQGVDWSPQVTFTEYTLDASILNKISDDASLFIISKGVDAWPLLSGLPELRKMDFAERMGITHQELRGVFDNYELVVLDHSAEWSDVALQAFAQLEREGKMIAFSDFLNQLVTTPP